MATLVGDCHAAALATLVGDCHAAALAATMQPRDVMSMFYVYS